MVFGNATSYWWSYLRSRQLLQTDARAQNIKGLPYWPTQHNWTQYRDNQEMDQEDPPTVSLPRSKPQDYNEHIEDVDDIEDIVDIDEDEVL